MIHCEIFVMILCLILDFLYKINCVFFFQIELLPVLNELKWIRFLESKQDVMITFEYGNVFHTLANL